MTENISLLKLQDAWRECERHVHHMFHAIDSLRPLWPFTAEKYVGMTDEQIQDVDQFILRFSKLQDAIGGRFFPAILLYLEELYDNHPMIDKLNRLEKLGFIESAEKWRRIRNIRNKFAHDYPDDMDKNAQTLNLALETALDLYDLLDTAWNGLLRNRPELMLGKPLPKDKPNWLVRPL